MPVKDTPLPKNIDRINNKAIEVELVPEGNSPSSLIKRYRITEVIAKNIDPVNPKADNVAVIKI